MLRSLILLFCLSPIAHASEIDSSLSDLKVEQGVALFVQEKKLKFLKRPIRSSGLLKIGNNSVLWHVTKPVESKLLVSGSKLWQFDSKKGSYKALANQQSIEQIVQTLFTAQFDETLWHISKVEKGCFDLIAKDQMIKGVVESIGFCLLSENKRKITLLDGQGNVTDIQLNFTSFSLSENDINDLKSPN